MIHCYYHGADLDGHCSGAIVKKYFNDRGMYANLVPVDYGDSPNWEEISVGDTVFVVDFSFPREVMRELDHTCEFLIWIDHHKTAINDLEDLELLYLKSLFKLIRQI